MTQNLQRSLEPVRVLVDMWKSRRRSHKRTQIWHDMAFIHHLFNTADSGESGGETGRETEEDGMQQRCEASTSQSHGVYLNLTRNY